MDNTSYIEISKKAYRSNIRFLSKVVGENVKISSVVKGNAYGHGYEQIIPIAEEFGINHFSVFSAFEAKQVAKFSSKKTDIMIFGFITNEQLEWVIDNEIEFYIFDLDYLKKASQIASRLNKTAKIHIELETGFKRTGIEPEEFDEMILFIHQNQESFSIMGLCTHFAGAESIANYVRIKSQLLLFKKYHKYFLNNGINPKYLHTSSSSASLIYPETRFNMVRIGIAQYGFWPTPEVLITRNNKYGDKESSLKRVISWKSEIMAIKCVKKGEFVGYGNSFQASKDIKIAIIPVGYNNGYSRSLSNRGHVLIHGKRADVLGVVTMNTISVNITDIKTAEVGDEVILIGNHNKNKITIASFSEMSNYLNYQVLARLPENIPRFVVE
ncbi:MAG: alanine racemase [Bacteroidales bacterium]|nr:alanine racemase [Bacteroidales bacterium]